MSLCRAVARVDLGAIRHNAARLADRAGPAALCAVVKADGYGHGAVPVARAALAGGARRLGVASLAEGEALRAGGVDAPVLVFGPLTGEEWRRAIAAAVEVSVWTPEACRAAAQAGLAAHIKLDTGMGRMGVRADARAALVEAAEATGLAVVGLMTHCATADELEGDGAAFFREQLLRFRSAVGPLRDRFPGAIVHAANSAAVLRGEEARFEMVRCGIALYGCSPFRDDPAGHGLRPAMSLASYVASVKPLHSRESVGYGRTYRAARGTTIAAVPLGYGDGYAWALGNRARALVGGRSVPVVGAISMDQLTLDLGPEGTARVGEEVVLLGTQGDERILAEELAELRGTIAYEVLCAIGPRVVRRYDG